MKQIEMIELVRQHHPHLGETEIRKLLDRAIEDFSAKTEIFESEESITTTADQRFYNLSSNILKIKKVWYNNTEIPRFIGQPSIDDPT